MSSRGSPAFPKEHSGGILLCIFGGPGSRLPLGNHKGTLPGSGDGARSLACSPNRGNLQGNSMHERDHKGNDSDSPMMPGNRAPEDAVGAAALTPPPLSNAPLSGAPTLPH